MRVGLYFFLLFLCVAADLKYGVTTLLLKDIFYSHDDVPLTIFKLRLIGTTEAFLAGAYLAACGAILQKILRNPLCDPFILGISSGGSCFVAIFSMIGISFIPQILSFESIIPFQSVAAVSGCLIAFAAMFFMKKHMASFNDEYVFPVIGIILNSFFSSIMLFMIAIANPTERDMIQSLLIGSILPLDARVVGTLFLGSLFPLIFLLKNSRFLNMLMFGDDFAKSMGLQPEKIRNKIVFCICILVSIVVSFAGTVGFVGLLIPHIVKKLHPHMTPFEEVFLSLLLGGSVFILSHLLSRVLIPPTELSVGILTALIGTPCLAYLILKKSRTTS
jgi:iron complex transport system permease protein